VVDILQVLEGATYLAFIVGAIVAVYELRDMKKDRRLALVMQAMTHHTTLEFEDAVGKLWRANATDAAGLEKQVGYAELGMITDFYWSIAQLGLQGVVDRKMLYPFFPFRSVWSRIKPFVIAERAATGLANSWIELEKIAQLQEREDNSAASVQKV